MNEQELKNFLERLASGTYTNEEYTLFTEWVENSPREEYEQMLVYWEQLVDDREIYEAVSPQLIANIEGGLDKIDQRKAKLRYLWPRIAAAASVLFVLGAGAYVVLHQPAKTTQVAQNNTIIQPGGNKAILYTNGRKIVLNTAKIGTLVQEAGATVDKNSEGQISYAANNNSEQKTIYDTLTTPRAGKFQLKLADGTKLWLNAATTIRYPEQFAGNERKVELITGEAFYEVVHNAQRPFRVTVNKQTVEDIGTHFNINAYTDEGAVKTTLVEGSVKVSADNSSKVLVPGEQSTLTNEGLKIAKVDTRLVTAWIDGYFSYKEASIPTVMRDLARWYDVQVVYEGKVTGRTFTGDIHRDLTLAQALDLLSFTKIHFKIEGRKIIVKP